LTRPPGIREHNSLQTATADAGHPEREFVKRGDDSRPATDRRPVIGEVLAPHFPALPVLERERGASEAPAEAWPGDLPGRRELLAVASPASAT
jgi:hypothetical protein